MPTPGKGDSRFIVLCPVKAQGGRAFPYKGGLGQGEQGDCWVQHFGGMSQAREHKALLVFSTRK